MTTYSNSQQMEILVLNMSNPMSDGTCTTEVANQKSVSKLSNNANNLE